MNGQVSINSTELSSAISSLSTASTALESEALAAISSDFKALEECGLFTSGLSTLKSNIEKIVANQKALISSLQAHLQQLQEQEEGISTLIDQYDPGRRSDGNKNPGRRSQYDGTDTEDPKKGKKISTSDISTAINNLDFSGAKTLLKSLADKAKEYNTTVTELLLNPEKSGLLYEILKKINGDTDGHIDTTSTEDSNKIQKQLLTQLSSYDDNAFASLSEETILKAIKYLEAFAKSKGLTLEQLLFDDKNVAKLIIALRNIYDGKQLEGYELTQEEIDAVKKFLDELAKKEGKTVDQLLSSTSFINKIKQYTKTTIIKKEPEPDPGTGDGGKPGQGQTGTPVDTSTLPKVGEHTSSWSTLGESWIVPTTKVNVKSYAAHVAGKRIAQDNDPSKYGDTCLSFAETYASNLYRGQTGDGADRASKYPHSTDFTSFINDDKRTILNKIYAEVVSGRPVVVQVNGNKAGTSRHFVTVIGIRSNVTDPNKLTEDDLLIMDSWDGKVERMDQANSRFFTTGAACHKNYSGYYLRVLKA